jgi:hypothetical protein
VSKYSAVKGDFHEIVEGIGQPKQQRDEVEVKAIGGVIAEEFEGACVHDGQGGAAG